MMCDVSIVSLECDGSQQTQQERLLLLFFDRFCFRFFTLELVGLEAPHSLLLLTRALFSRGMPQSF